MTDPGHIDWYPTDEERAAGRRADCAEAVAAERERITREVGALERYEALSPLVYAVTPKGSALARAAVLAIVNPEADDA